MKTKLSIIVFAIIMAGSLNGIAQKKSGGSSYTNGVGLRAGEPSGLTFKHFTGSNTAIEGIANFWPYGFGITGLYEIHANAFDVRGLKWYYGPGAHVQLYQTSAYYISRRGPWAYDRVYTTSGIGIGIDGVLGLEYKIQEIPFTLSLDIKPSIEFTSYRRVYPDFDAGLSLRYTF